MKFEKRKTYTYEEIKEIIEDGIKKTAFKPMGKEGEELQKKGDLKNFEMREFMMGLESIIIFHTFRKNINLEEE